MKRIVLILLVITGIGTAAQQAPSSAARSTPAAANPNKHFDRVLIVVLENQPYVTAIKDKYLKQLADEGVEFTDFHGLAHPSYPNYLGLIAGNTFGMRGVFGDDQKDFPDDNQHRTIGDELDWKNYAEDYPAKPGQGPYLNDTSKYRRKHVPFLSFIKVQKQGFQNVVSVDTKNPHNAFVTDVENSRLDPKDSKYKALPRYMFYSPNMDDDGHDTNLGTASTWLKNFLENWFPRDSREGTLLIVTFDESEAPERKSNHIYTVFLGDMVKAGQKVDVRYDHYDILRTIEDNFGVQPLNAGDSHAKVITGIWNR